MFSLTSIFRGPSSLLRTLPAVPSPISLFTRNRGQLAPRQIKYIKRHKGRVPIPIGGSIRGTTLAFGDWGIRIKGNGHRLSAKQLTTAEDVIKRKIKPFKGAKVWLRCFPDIPVCIKVRGLRYISGCMSDESYRATKLVWERARGRSSTGRLGCLLAVSFLKSEASPFEKSSRAKVGRILAQLHRLICRFLVLRQAASKLPCTMEFISMKSPPRLGRLLLHDTPEPSHTPLLEEAPTPIQPQVSL